MYHMGASKKWEDAKTNSNDSSYKDSRGSTDPCGAIEAGAPKKGSPLPCFGKPHTGTWTLGSKDLCFRVFGPSDHII